MGRSSVLPLRRTERLSFDLDKGEIRVLHNLQGSRNLSFMPGGDLLLTYESSRGESGAILVGRADFRLHPIPFVPLSNLPDDVLGAACAAGRDIWLVIHPRGKETLKVVRVTPK